jgi:hypothetical protein
LWEGAGGRGRSRSVLDGEQDTLEILEHLEVRKPQNADALRLHPSVARGIDLSVYVRYTINLNDQPCRRAIEIYDVGTKRRLSAKLQAFKPVVPQPLPNQLFRRRWIVAHPSSVG